MTLKTLTILFVSVPLAFYSGSRDPFLIKEPLAQSLVLAALLLAWAENRLSGAPVRRPGLLWLFLCFFAAVLFSVRTAAHPALVFQFFSWTLVWASLYFLGAQMREPAQIKTVFKAVFAASALAALYGAMQRGGADFMVWAQSWGDRPGATFGNPNFAAGWWVLALPLAVFYFWEKSPKKVIAGTALTGLMAANLYWGKTRGAWLALALAAAVTLFLHGLEKALKKNNVSRFFSGAACGTVLLAFASALLAGILLMRASLNPSVLERRFKAETALAILKSSPITGVGAGNLKVHFALFQADVREKPVFRENMHFKATSESSVHNEFLQLAAETGILGLSAFVAIFVFWFRNFFQSLGNADRERRRLLQGILTAVLAFLFYAFSNFPLRIVPNACLLFFLLGAAEALLRTGPEKSRPAPARPAGLLLAGGALFMGTVFALWILPPFRADILRLKADRAAGAKDFQGAIRLYREAIRLDYYRSERTAYHLGECQRAAGSLTEAIAAYRIALSLRHYGEIYNNMGNCYYLLNQKQDAARNWETALRLGLPDPAAQKQTEDNLNIVLKSS